MPDNQGNNYGLLTFLVVIVALIYYPALDSRFLMDDYYNLTGLSDVGSKGVFYYISQGFAGPSSRPLSLLSFALQYQAWPDNPEVFKAANLIIHLINGVLIWFISRYLIQFLDVDKQYHLIFVFLVTSLWLLSPIQLSTVLYVIQRMTQISTLFILLGIFGYLKIRLSLPKKPDIYQYAVLGMIVVVTTSLAVFGKENGILLPLFILCIEGTILSKVEKPDNWKIWSWIFLIFPLILLCLYLLYGLEGTLMDYQNVRDFTVIERLLTEARILFDYIKIIVIPHPTAFSLYHDDYPLSQNLILPFSTLLAVLGILILVFFSFKWRKKFPVISFSIFWFLGGHVLESTYLSLELYFEHRNYLPSYGIIFLVSWFFIKLLKLFTNRTIIGLLLVSYGVLVMCVTIIEINIWSHPEIQIMEWSRNHPRSFRALNDLAGLHAINGNYDESLNVLEKMREIRPNSIYPDIQQIDIMVCNIKESIQESRWKRYIDFSKNASMNGLDVISAIDHLMHKIIKGDCQGIDLQKLNELLLGLYNNTNFYAQRTYIKQFLTTLSKIQ